MLTSRLRPCSRPCLRPFSLRVLAPPAPRRPLPLPPSPPFPHPAPALLHIERRRYPVPGPHGSAGFHSTPSPQAAPFIGLLALLKASAAIEIIRTTARVTLTFIPVLLMKNIMTRKFIRHFDRVRKDNPDALKIYGHDADKFASKRSNMLKNLRNRTILFHLLLFAPCLLFSAAVVASLERTPLTGRFRLILLSPEEEDGISTQLAGSGWYQAVTEIIAKDGPLRILPPGDWRYLWVRDTLRSLESVIDSLGHERALDPVWLQRADGDVPLPPPAEFPLRPRPRASELLHYFMCCMRGEKIGTQSSSHSIPGPPYSLLIIDDPDSCNAFSYGFGPDGAGGIVVFSGFIDKILKDHPYRPPPPPPQDDSWWFQLFGGLFSVPPPPPRFQPTYEQTTDLAILLAHELSHLILSHHLETLSSMTIFIPGVLSICSDFLRTLLFPITMLFGPFVNDALGDLGQLTSVELSKYGDYCTTAQQEIEADVVSVRLLAHAGFDPRLAVQFWERRDDAECAPGSVTHQQREDQLQHSYARRIMGSGHPINKLRVERLRAELERWVRERTRVRAEQDSAAAAAAASV
ncbi:hypothetical protein OF83DRAFT_1048941 [Amylostereum chailletii]|nr:hypothetical protein OF83DRAFT_1048941 [Amylostereum chailletii]